MSQGTVNHTKIIDFFSVDITVNITDTNANIRWRFIMLITLMHEDINSSLFFGTTELSPLFTKNY